MNLKYNIFLILLIISLLTFIIIKKSQSYIRMNKVVRLFKVDYEVYGRVQG